MADLDELKLVDKYFDVHYGKESDESDTSHVTI